MKKGLLTLCIALAAFSLKAQNNFSYEAVVGITPNSGYTFSGQKGFQNIFGGALVSYQVSISPWEILSGFEINAGQLTPDFIRIPLKVNYSFGQQQSFFLGAGASYNKTISAFTDTYPNATDLLFEAGTKISLNSTLTLVSRVTYSYGMNKNTYDGNNYYRINYLMVSAALRFHPKKKI